MIYRNNPKPQEKLLSPSLQKYIQNHLNNLVVQVKMKNLSSSLELVILGDDDLESEAESHDSEAEVILFFILFFFFPLDGIRCSSICDGCLIEILNKIVNNLFISRFKICLFVSLLFESFHTRFSA